MKIIRCPWTEIESDPNLKDLVSEGYEEGGLKLFERGKLQEEMYRVLNEKGVLKVIKAEVDDALAGYAGVLLHVSMHYSVLVAQLESIYVLKRYRYTGAGLGLIKEAELIAKEAKVPVLFFNTPIGSIFEEILNKKDYEPTHTIYCKRFNYDVAKNAA